MLGCGSPREHTFTNQTPADILTDNFEHLANLVGANGAYASLSVFISSHCFWKNFDPPSNPILE